MAYLNQNLDEKIKKPTLGSTDKAVQLSTLTIVKGLISQLESSVENKVDKVPGKYLSTNDFTDALKTKLEEIDAQANKITIDSALDSDSTNPVQNKIIKYAIDNLTTAVSNLDNSKVNKEIGKGLSSNDFNNSYKAFLDSFVIDSTPIEDSTHPISSGAVYSTMQTLTEIANGRVKSYVLDGVSSFQSTNTTITLSIDTELTTADYSTIDVADLNIGDVILLKDADYPDRWVSGKSDESISFTILETTKVDLSGYLTASDIVAGSNITITRANGVVTISSTDNDTTYSAATTSSAGLMPALLSSTLSSQNQSTKFLREDGSWAAPAYTTSISVATSNSLGTVKSSITGTTADRTYCVEVNNDGTMKVNVPWVDTNTTYSAATTSAAGLMPALNSSGILSQSQSTKFLREDGTWSVPSYTTDKEVFLAIYGTTTYNEITAALDADKLVVLQRTSGYWLLTHHNTSPNDYKFTGIRDDVSYEFIVNDSNEWSYEIYPLQLTLYKVNSITSSNTTTNNNYPSAKAVYEFVNSSISSNTAYFLGTYNLVSDLSGSIDDTHSDVEGEIATYLQSNPPASGISNNDYVFIQIPTADSTPTVIAQIDRYKYNSEDEEWLYEYTLNNSGFTASQWATINSGVDATKVGNYDTHVANTTIHVTSADKTAWDGYASSKQDVIDASHPLSSAYINDGVDNTAHRFVTASMYNYLDDLLYATPTVSSFTLVGSIDNGSSQDISNNADVEIGSTVIITAFKHKESNISNITGTLTLGDGTVGVANPLIVRDIAKSSTVATVNLSTAYTLIPSPSSNKSFIQISGTNSKGNIFSGSVGVNYKNYVYYKFTSSTTTPTNNLNKSVEIATTTNQFNITYAANDYIYFYHTSSGKHVQQYSLGQWNNVPQTDLGQVTITKANGTTGTYYAYRVGPFTSGGTDTFRIA